MNIYWNAAAVINDRDRVILIDSDFDLRAKAGHSLIHRVIDHLIDQMMKSAREGVTDIHGRPSTNRFHTLKNLDVRGVVIMTLFVFGLVLCHYIFPTLK